MIVMTMDFTHASAPRLILASQSPRRKYLLEQAGLTFDVIPSQFDEDAISLDDPAVYVRTLATEKANAVAALYPDSWVIGADTIVVAGRAVLGKPADAGEAREMIARLSGQTHEVYTGYAISCKQAAACHTDVAMTRVQFKTLTDAEIDWYISTGEPFDKAGAYAIQGLGTFLVKAVNGSYTNVVGLPVCEVIELLLKLGVVQLDAAHAKLVTV